jgi:hypothetical protein
VFREHIHSHLRGSSAVFSGSFGHRPLLRGHGNDQRSLASVGAYVTGSLSSKSGPYDAQLFWSSFIIAARSAVSLAGGAVTVTGLL